MLPPRHVVFSALEGTLLNVGSRSLAPAADAVEELAARGVPLILCTAYTRAEIEPLRRKIGHSYPFITESGGGLFIPDGYFSQKLEGAARAGRYFCVPFGRSQTEAAAAIEEIATEAGADVVLYSQMSVREIAANTGQPVREAELSRQRDFSERFFFAGGTEATVSRFSSIAAERGWQSASEGAFWELRSGNDVRRAVRYLMQTYRDALRSRLSSVGVGSRDQDVELLCAVDLPIVLPKRKGESEAVLMARLSHPFAAASPGPEGWSEAVLSVLQRH